MICKNIVLFKWGERKRKRERDGKKKVRGNGEETHMRKIDRKR